VELPPNYDQTRGLLQAIDRALRSTHGATPITSYDQTYAVNTALRENETDARSGSLYDTDNRRLKKDKGYVVERREPESRNRESRRRSPNPRREREQISKG
jgi:hypothetical protein